MLSTPPAFILSQDQTLRSKAASPPPTDHVSVILFENSPSGPRAPDREKVKACSLECPSDIREDVCSVSRIPSSVSGCQGSAGGFPPRRPRERRKEILYRDSHPPSSGSRNLDNFAFPPDATARTAGGAAFRTSEKGSSHMIQLPGFRARGFLKNLSSARMAPETAENPSQYVMRRLV